MFSKLFKKPEESETMDQEGLQLPQTAAFTPPVLENGQLAGKCLVASPFMPDTRFRNAVVFMCSHSDKGAMGLVINHSVDDPGFIEVLKQFDIEGNEDTPDVTLVQGGPMENTRGLVLHSDDYKDHSTQGIGQGLALSCSLDILRALADDKGPRYALLALGYAGWTAGQLESELTEDSWIVADTSMDLLFEISCNHRWEAALSSMGIQPAFISQASGRA